MKKLSIYLFTLFISSLGLMAQSDTLRQVQLTHEKTPYLAYEVSLNQSPEQVKDYLGDYFKDRFDIDLKGDGFLSSREVLKAKEVAFPRIMGNASPITLYLKVNGLENRSRLALFMDIPASETSRIDTRPFAAAKAFVQELKASHDTYAQQQSINQLLAEIKDTHSELTDLKKEQAKLRESIREAEAKILSLEEQKIMDQRQIEVNQEAMTQLNQVLALQNHRLEELQAEQIDDSQ